RVDVLTGLRAVAEAVGRGDQLSRLDIRDVGDAVDGSVVALRLRQGQLFHVGQGPIRRDVSGSDTSLVAFALKNSGHAALAVEVEVPHGGGFEVVGRGSQLPFTAGHWFDVQGFARHTLAPGLAI